MSHALASSLGIVAYLTLFFGVGLVFLFANLLVGRFVRPADPHPDKREIYECGEPTIGSSFVQFDLRFYVVALVFIVFDVEVAFLFPASVVFGKATHLADERMAVVAVSAEGSATLTPDAALLYRELGVANPQAPADAATAERTIRHGARQLAMFTGGAIGLFFIVLLIGFAYEWKTGSLDWVRAVTREFHAERAAARAAAAPDEPALTA